MRATQIFFFFSCFTRSKGKWTGGVSREQRAQPSLGERAHTQRHNSHAAVTRHTLLHRLTHTQQGRVCTRLHIGSRQNGLRFGHNGLNNLRNEMTEHVDSLCTPYAMWRRAGAVYSCNVYGAWSNILFSFAVVVLTCNLITSNCCCVRYSWVQCFSVFASTASGKRSIALCSPYDEWRNMRLTARHAPHCANGEGQYNSPFFF